MMTKPEVFIIESLLEADYQNNRCEGDLISKILTMGGRTPIYRYVETRQTFMDALREFQESDYRYLHISSHGADDHFLFQFGEIYFNEFHTYIKLILNGRRVFISACDAVNHINHELANVILRDTGCQSLIGSAEPIDFDDAAMFWSTFYYLAYQDQGDVTKVTRDLIINILRKLTNLYPLDMNYYAFSRSQGIKLDRFSKGTKKRL